MLCSSVNSMHKVLMFCFVLLMLMVFAHEGHAMKHIASLRSGVVFAIELQEHGYLVTLDNGSTGLIPLEHPIREYFTDKKVLFPHFINAGVALVSYTDGSSDWLPARLAVSVQGRVVVNKNHYKIHEYSFEHFASLSQQRGKNQNTGYAYVTSMPVPSGYTLFLDPQYAKHNFTVLQQLAVAQADSQLVDMVYTYTKGTGYILVYVQPTRFTQKYCEQMGIQTTAK